MRISPQIAATLAVATSVLACNLPGNDAVSAAATAFAGTQTAEADAEPSDTLAPGETPAETAAVEASPTACSPIVAANLNANIRAGDSTDYEITGFLPTGDSRPLVGRNAADTWWYITDGPGHGWIAKSVVTASCLPPTVAVVEPPPLPPTQTPSPEPVEFAVTSVTYTFSEDPVDHGGKSDCPLVTAHITVNGGGDVTYAWKRSDGSGPPPESLHFAAAGTQDVSQGWWLPHIQEGTEHWLGIYIDDPNHQQFGHKSFTDACDG
jgi:hypothetical protein